MTLNLPGAGTSHSEVTNITSGGFWLLVDDREYFVPFDHYPGFREATVIQIYQMQAPGPGQVSWSDLDIDIELAALAQPERFPLIFRS